MKKILIIFILLLLPNLAHAKANYTYYEADNQEIAGITDQQKESNQVKLKANYGLSNNKCYIKIKANNKQIIKISSPKLSNNSILKLVNVVF